MSETAAVPQTDNHRVTSVATTPGHHGRDLYYLRCSCGEHGWFTAELKRIHP